jgi:hypothetical protein
MIVVTAAAVALGACGRDEAEELPAVEEITPEPPPPPATVPVPIDTMPVDTMRGDTSRDTLTTTTNM